MPVVPCRYGKAHSRGISLPLARGTAPAPVIASSEILKLARLLSIGAGFRRREGGGRRMVAGKAGRRSALVVEDDDQIAFLLKFILEREGFDVRVAPDGRQAGQ